MMTPAALPGCLKRQRWGRRNRTSTAGLIINRGACVNLVRNGSSDQRPKIRSARANSKHTKPIVAAIKAISKRKRFLVMGEKYRSRAIRQLILKVNLSDQH